MLIFCPSCNAALPEHLLQRSRLEAACPTCSRALKLTLFPALFRPTAKIDLQSQQSMEGESTCFEHADKKAVAVCHRCGRFVCALCEVEVAGQTWCPSCLVPGGESKPVQALEKSRTLYDSVALALASLPWLLLFYPVILTAPTTIYCSIRYWKRPSSMVPRGKWRFVVALLIALAQIALLVAIVVSIVITQRRRGNIE